MKTKHNHRMKSGDKFYIWQHDDWPNWAYNQQRLTPLLAQVHRAQGRLLGRMHDMGLDLKDQAALRALTDDGQYLVIGFVAGIPMLPANQVLLRNRRITGVDWGAWAMKNPDLNNANLAKVLELIDNGKLSPVEPVTYALRDAACALTDIQARKIAGKVALIP